MSARYVMTFVYRFESLQDVLLQGQNAEKMAISADVTHGSSWAGVIGPYCFALQWLSPCFLSEEEK